MSFVIDKKGKKIITGRFEKFESGVYQIIFYCPGCKSFEWINSSWKFDGNVDNPTIHPSVKSITTLNGKEVSLCHHFIKAGKIQFLNDCQHELKGQTVDLPDIPFDRFKRMYGIK